MGTIKVKDRQSLLDVQLIASGTLEGIIRLCALNGLALTDELSDGQVIGFAASPVGELVTGEVSDTRTARLYAYRGISPATAIEETGGIIMGGIGYMAVGLDFIVS